MSESQYKFDSRKMGETGAKYFLFDVFDIH